MRQIYSVRLLTVLTFILSLTQISCGEHICLPTILSVFYSLFINASFEFWGLAYFLGTFGQIYVIARPDSNPAKYVYGICFLSLLFPAFTYYSYWQDYHKWINNNIFWWFHIPFLILGLTNLYLLFKKKHL
jgi:hypothetical protein